MTRVRKVAAFDHQPTFSVVVPTYNRPQQLTRCLEALAALEQGGNPYAGTVAYRLLALASSDDSPDVIEGLFAKAIELGRQQARRLELARTLKAAGEWLVAQPEPERQQRGDELLSEAAEIYQTIGLSKEDGEQ